LYKHCGHKQLLILLGLQFNYFILNVGDTAGKQALNTGEVTEESVSHATMLTALKEDSAILPHD